MFKWGGRGVYGADTLAASANATLTRARHAHAVRSLMSRSYVICGFKLFFSRPLNYAARRCGESGPARVSLPLCFTAENRR